MSLLEENLTLQIVQFILYIFLRKFLTSRRWLFQFEPFLCVSSVKIEDGVLRYKFFRFSNTSFPFFYITIFFLFLMKMIFFGFLAIVVDLDVANSWLIAIHNFLFIFPCLDDIIFLTFSHRCCKYLFFSALFCCSISAYL